MREISDEILSVCMAARENEDTGSREFRMIDRMIDIVGTWIVFKKI